MKTTHNNAPRLSRVRSAIYGQPWAITPEWLDAICEIFERNVNAEKIEFDLEAKLQIASAGGPRVREGEYRIQDGTAIIPLMGPIFPRANMMTRMSGATSLEEWSGMFSHALSNEKVSSIFYPIDSPGGSVLLLGETATKIFNARSSQPKPIIALAEGMCCSAAFMLGSQADEFYATEGALVGSIGTVMRIDSDERQKLNAGIDPIILKSGKFKAIGNGPVTEEQRAHYQGILEDYFGRFKDAVSRARPEVNIEQVATGEIWIGAKAQSLGLIDGISTMDALLARMAD